MHNHHAPRLGTAVQGHPEPSPRLSRPHHARVHILLLVLDHPAAPPPHPPDETEAALLGQARRGPGLRARAPRLVRPEGRGRRRDLRAACDGERFA